MHFDEVYEFLLGHHWRFSGGGTALDVLEDFGERTGLLAVDFDQQRVYRTELAKNPDDRTLANMMIAEWSQLPDRDGRYARVGTEVISINELIEDLRHLRPRGLEYMRLYRLSEDDDLED